MLNFGSDRKSDACHLSSSELQKMGGGIPPPRLLNGQAERQAGKPDGGLGQFHPLLPVLACSLQQRRSHSCLE